MHPLTARDTVRAFVSFVTGGARDLLQDATEDGAQSLAVCHFMPFPGLIRDVRSIAGRWRVAMRQLPCQLFWGSKLIITFLAEGRPALVQLCVLLSRYIRRYIYVNFHVVIIFIMSELIVCDCHPAYCQPACNQPGRRL